MNSNFVMRRLLASAVVLLAACSSTTGAAVSKDSSVLPRSVSSPIEAAGLPAAPRLEGEIPIVILEGLPGAVEASMGIDQDDAPCEAFTVQGPLFKSGSDELTDEATSVLERLIDRLREIPGHVTVTGHTDRRPVVGGNQRLSEMRAAAVAKYLLRHGIGQDGISTIGMGDRAPATEGDSQAAYRQNRRVEITVACPQGSE